MFCSGTNFSSKSSTKTLLTSICVVVVGFFSHLCTRKYTDDKHYDQANQCCIYCTLTLNHFRECVLKIISWKHSCKEGEHFFATCHGGCKFSVKFEHASFISLEKQQQSIVKKWEENQRKTNWQDSLLIVSKIRKLCVNISISMWILCYELKI